MYCSSRLPFRGPLPRSSRTRLLGASERLAARHIGKAINHLVYFIAHLPVNNSMVGALNKLPVAASGMIFFGDPVTLGSVSAVSAGFLAGLVYAIAKNNQNKAEKSKNDAPLPLHNRKPMSH